MVNKRVRDVDQFFYCTVLGAVQGLTAGGVMQLLGALFIDDKTNRYMLLILGAVFFVAGIVMWWKQNQLHLSPFYKDCQHVHRCIFPNREWCEFHQRITNKLD